MAFNAFCVHSGDIALKGRLQGMGLNLYTNWYVDPNNERAKEIADCLEKNLNNHEIDNVVVVTQVDIEKRGKMTVARTDQRPTFKDLFCLINMVSGAEDVNIVA